MTTIERPSSMDIDVNVIRAGELADDEEPERSPITDKPTSQARNTGDDNADDGIDHTDDDPHGRRGSANGKKHRRGKTKGGKRHWKPYNKLSWEERQALDERETRRAQRKRQERFANGQPMAPYNTTQFLMEQHQADDPDFIIEVNGVRRQRADGNGSGSVESSEEYYDSPDNEDLFMAKDFSETYNNVHAERLQNMSKEELIRELLELESRVERLEKKDDSGGIAPASKDGDDVIPPTSTRSDSRLPSEESIDIRNAATLEAEIRRLRNENDKLRQENNKMKSEGGRSPNA